MYDAPTTTRQIFLQFWWSWHGSEGILCQPNLGPGFVYINLATDPSFNYQNQSCHDYQNKMGHGKHLWKNIFIPTFLDCSILMTEELKMMPVLVIALSGCDRGSGDGGVWPVAVWWELAVSHPTLPGRLLGSEESRVAQGMGKDVGCGHQALGWDRGPTDFWWETLHTRHHAGNSQHSL